MAGRYVGSPGSSALSGKKRKRKRLKAMNPFEVAGVPGGANRGGFVVMKEDGSMQLDISKLEAAHAAIGKVITVCKSGTPSVEAVEELSKDLNVIYSDLGSLLGEGKQVDKVGLKTRLDEITSLAESLNESTHDLNMQDQLDSLMSKAKEVAAQVEKLEVKIEQQPAPAPAVAPAQTPAVPTPTEQITAPAPAAAPVVTAAPAVATPAAAPVIAPAAAVTDAAAAAAVAAAPAAATSDDEGDEIEIVTKADLQSFGQTLVEGFKGAMTELVTTLKGAPPTAVPATPVTTQKGTILPPNGQSVEGAGFVAPKDEPDAYDSKHWGNHYDLNSEN